MDKRKLDDYRTMMADRVRMQAYLQAIARVCPGRTVCEIGVGLGPLSLMALHAGARRVYGIELDPLALDLARRVMADNGFDETRFVPVPGLSTEVELPERVDVVLSETVDGLGVGENTVRFMRDAAERFLAPGGVFLPRALDCHVALAHCESHDRERRFWSEELPTRYRMRFGPVVELISRLRATVEIGPEHLRTPWATWQTIEFADPSTYRPTCELALRVLDPGRCNGVVTAFEMELAEGVRLATRPDGPPTHWHQGFVPLPHPVPLERGQRLRLRIALQENDAPSIGFDAELDLWNDPVAPR